MTRQSFLLHQMSRCTRQKEKAGIQGSSHKSGKGTFNEICEISIAQGRGRQKSRIFFIPLAKFEKS